MRKASVVVNLLLLIALCSCGRQPEHATPLLQEAPRIVIEAEAADEIVPPVAVFEDEQASGGRYLLAPEGPDHQELSKGGSARYTFTVKKPGRYVLWIRKNWCCSCGNSLLVSVDGGKEFIFGEDGTYGRWDWARAIGKEFDLSAGQHTLLIKNREDGAKFDQILLTTDKKYVPVGVEKP